MSRRYSQYPQYDHDDSYDFPEEWLRASEEDEAVQKQMESDPEYLSWLDDCAFQKKYDADQSMIPCMPVKF